MVEEWARREWRFWVESGNVLSAGEANQQDA
jgi:hypothetical protein